MQPTEEDKHPWSAPLKGWAPRGWDDGSGFSRKNGQPMPDGYFTGSNHLAQDLADALLNVWLSTRDPQVAEAAGDIRLYQEEKLRPNQGDHFVAAASTGPGGCF